MLLKNGKNVNSTILPLPKKARKILVAGTHADNLGYQCGGWTIAWQGFSGNNYTTGMFVARKLNICKLLVRTSLNTTVRQEFVNPVTD